MSVKIQTEKNYNLYLEIYIYRQKNTLLKNTYTKKIYIYNKFKIPMLITVLFTDIFNIYTYCFYIYTYLPAKINSNKTENQT